MIGEAGLLSEKYLEAFELAFQLHNQQLRKSTNIPYIAHLMSVSALVLESGGTENEAIAALLHDAVEDQGGKPVLAEIDRRFGGAVAKIVRGCSDSYGHPKPPWKVRKQQYLERLKSEESSVLLVSLADKLHNLRDILLTYRRERERTWERFNGGKEGTLWYYGQLVQIFADKGHPELAVELSRTFQKLRQLVNQQSEKGDHERGIF